MTDFDYAEYIARGSGITLLAMAGTAVASFVLRLLMARFLPPANYGLFFSVFAFISFFTMVRHLGIDRAVAKFIPEFKSKGEAGEIRSLLSTALVIQAGLAISVSLLLISLSGWLSTSFFGNPGARTVLIVLSIWFAVMMVVRFLREIFRGFKDMGGRAGVELFRMVSTLGLVSVVFYFVEPSLWGASLAFLLGGIFSAVAFLFLAKKRHLDHLEGDGSISGGKAKDLISFGLPLVLAGLASTILGRIDTVMITGLRSLKAVGLYQVARPTTRFLGYVGTALSVPLMPMISELWAKGDENTLQSTLSYLSKFSIILVIPVALIFLAFPDIVIRLLFGPKYLAATTAMRILAVGITIGVGGSILASTLTGSGHPEANLKAMGTAAAFNVPANFLLVPPFGAGGAAIATSLSLLIALILRFYFLRGVIRFPIPIASIVKTLAGGGLTLIVIDVLRRIVSLGMWAEFFAVLIPSGLFYIGWICMTGAITEEDLDLFEQATPVPSRVITLFRKITK